MLRGPRDRFVLPQDEEQIVPKAFITAMKPFV
jgi:hypothetical protein